MFAYLVTFTLFRIDPSISNKAEFKNYKKPVLALQ